MSNPQPTPRRRSSRPRPAGLDLQVDPRHLEFHQLTWIDWLQEIRVSGGLGFVISLLLHLIVLAVLAWLIIEFPSREPLDPYIASWLDPAEIPVESQRVRQPVALPLSMIPTVAANTPTPEQAKPVPTEASAPPKPKVVDVGRALENRRTLMESDAAALERTGGSVAAQRAIKSGLAWLARQQTPSGHWELHQGYPDHGTSTLRTDTGATALALLSFLGAGQTSVEGEHAAVIEKGLRWLVDVQDQATGDLHDQRQEEGRNPAFYAHAMATIALCEALALTRDESLRPAAERSVQYLIKSQHPEQGGWKYRPISKLMVGDLSVTGWALMALHTARMADIPVSDEEFERAASFLDSVSERGGSRYKYEPQYPPGSVTPALTAEGLLCRQWFGWPRDFPPMVDGVHSLVEEQLRPQWTGGRRNVYEWYYIAQVLHNLGGDDWKNWYLPTRDQIVKAQVTGGSARSPNDVRGSWHPTQPSGVGHEYADKAGRLYITAMCLLILETPTRHRPLYAE